MKIGIAVPCRYNDIPTLEKYCLPSITNLNPKPDTVSIYLNKGKTVNRFKKNQILKKIKEKLYHNLFVNHKCDIVLQCDSDFYLFKDILKYVNKGYLTNFITMVKTPLASLMKVVFCNFVKNTWSGCYAIPKQVWYKQVINSPYWDGTDTGVKLAVKLNYRSIRTPKFMLMRRSKKRFREITIHHPLNRDKPLYDKMVRLGMTLGV